MKFKAIERPDGKFRLRGQASGKPEVDYGDYLTLEAADAAVLRILYPRVYHYDDKGNRLPPSK